MWPWASEGFVSFSFRIFTLSQRHGIVEYPLLEILYSFFRFKRHRVSSSKAQDWAFGKQPDLSGVSWKKGGSKTRYKNRFTLYLSKKHLCLFDKSHQRHQRIRLDHNEWYSVSSTNRNRLFPVGRTSFCFLLCQEGRCLSSVVIIHTMILLLHYSMFLLLLHYSMFLLARSRAQSLV